VKIDGVVAGQLQAKLGVDQPHLGHQRLGEIAQIALPARPAEPRKLPIGPHAHPTGRAIGLVLAPDVGIVDIAELIVLVKADQQPSIA